MVGGVVGGVVSGVAGGVIKCCIEKITVNNVITRNGSYIVILF